MTTPSILPAPSHLRRFIPSHAAALFAVWLAIFFAALFTPPLLDDADATHAQAARAILATGDWVTLHVDGVRYLEKAPLPYWLVAACFRLFGFNAFAAHLPGALAVLALAALGYHWSRRAFDDRTALYTGLATLTCTGAFLFTRVFLPDALLSLFLAASLYSFERSLERTSTIANTSPGAPFMPRTLRHERVYPYLLWTSLALAVLTKGLVALVLFLATALIYLILTKQLQRWRRLRPLSGLALFFIIAAPWHILAALRNTGGEGGHGFAWFYFINEHVLRFLGRRTPRDYNKLPAALYWLLHGVWLFPWSLFVPVGIIFAYRRWKTHTLRNPSTPLLLVIFSAVVLLFFSLSTNQEYYTFPAYLPLLMLIAAAIAAAERRADDRTLRRTLLAGHIAFIAIGLLIAAALATALYASRQHARPSDMGALLAHRAVAKYTLSMSSFFDLTVASFAALRLPAVLAGAALAVGPITALLLRRAHRQVAATTTVALTSAAFLIAAHIAMVRFTPMLSSKDFADRIDTLTTANRIAPNTQILLFGDQAYGSSIPFYLNRQVLLVDGRTTSMYFGSTFADAPKIFLTPQQLRDAWGTGPRKILFIPPERRQDAIALLGAPHTVLAESSGKLLITDRPLTPSTPSPTINTPAAR